MDKLNTLDVTGYRLAALQTNTVWFGRHLRAADWSAYQGSANEISPDGYSSGLPLTLLVDCSEPANVPVPAPFALLGIGPGGFAIVQIRRHGNSRSYA